ncbi:unnamed protein product [Brassicogethes aeneus]|uniref:Thioredoxin domain-containing protein 17 n=1 Tax=Brassicogethes aeneus TaxID=1431903 RepID=A0A9P0FJC1_BRAAE|nr:unnamed protein product [Brassicogethes aeneus]
MVITFDIVGYEAFDEFMANFSGNHKLVHIFFTASKCPNGKSWSEECNKVTQIIKDVSEHCDPESFIINVQVGDQLAWRDPDNPFKKDPRTNLQEIPTILRWKLNYKLQGDRCLESNNLKKMLTGDEI